ncbi:kinase-like protein, partial [Ramicandelaber brevisporus]
SLQHPNVVRTFAYVYEEGSDGLYSVMEAHSHDLFSEILRYPGQIMPADKSMAYFAQIAAALYYLHIDCRVAHRDIKLDNLVLSRDSQTAMLVDFGCARRFTPHIPAIAYSVCGSDPYIAPEILANSNCGGYANGKVVGYDAFKADVWALGIVFLALRSARFPWEL